MTEREAQALRDEFAGLSKEIRAAYRQGYADGVDAERAAVVAYLDDMMQDCFLVGRHREGRALAFYARRIESGEHRREGGE